MKVRYGETDQMGVVHHANYLLYMEEGRTRLMEDLGCSYAELERSGWGLPVRKTALRFRSSARYGDTLVIRSRVTKLGGASVAFAYQICSEAGELLAEGSSELACVGLDSADRRPKMLPEDLRALLEPAIG